ncbi:hypothetical protein BN7_867 [Wickerhamomyces ciferrii]|uniref:Uncharacterized protein n=1 Tax=Wickerhamomyces ciferrii (strain ATCC 14091 / BCRC 22168 / CBS 111 / JCM 3599 / NBRC 0793 / NRRL Y-1031 F-60-10) TaxID=1206466 RepID=K0KJQ8_WICCF|nr:uncharacterized protein BN7_867 [Wickerhamomyces ciferrii]CCH41328.1 hypothetical protein BN7_867 [Wickerhamomyces ciferrii]
MTNIMSKKVDDLNMCKFDLLSDILGGPYSLIMVNQLSIKRFIHFFYGLSKASEGKKVHRIYKFALEGYKGIWEVELMKIEIERLSILVNVVLGHFKGSDEFCDDIFPVLEELRFNISKGKVQQSSRQILRDTLFSLQEFIDGSKTYKKKKINSIIQDDLNILKDSLSLEVKVLNREDFMNLHKFPKLKENITKQNSIYNDHIIQKQKSNEVDDLLTSAEKESQDELDKRHEDVELTKNLENINNRQFGNGYENKDKFKAPSKQQNTKSHQVSPVINKQNPYQYSLRDDKLRDVYGNGARFSNF